MRTEQLIGQLLSSILDAETGQRGFLITSQYKYLAPYYLSLSRINGGIAALRREVSDSQEQIERVDLLQSAVDEKLSELAESITLHTRDGATTSQAFVRSNEGIAQMQTIRSILDAMSATERELLADRQRSYQVQKQITVATMMILVLTSIVLFAATVLLVRRQARLHGAAVSEHARHSHELGQSVQELQLERARIAEINELASLLQSCNSVNELGRVARSALARLFRGATGSLYLFAASRNQLVLLQESVEHSASVLVRPDECWGLRRGGPHHFAAADGVPACAHFSSDDAHGAALCLPLIAHGETIGLLTFQAPSGSEDDANLAFRDPDTRRNADMAARHLALAIANLQLRDSLKEQSIRDPLTGAFNRRYLDVVGEKEIAQSLRFSRPFAVVMLDVDHFKRFNDVHGHAAGDLVLVTVCDYLRRHTREGDWLFRYGGEEFVLLLREMRGADAAVKAEALRQGLSELTIISGDTALPPVTASMGIAVLTGNGERLGSVLERADEALYASKTAGRNRITLHERDRSDLEAPA